MRLPRHVALFVLGAVALLAAILLTRPPATAPIADGCLGCHASVTGIGGSHAAMGCAACHGGDRSATDAGRAHASMVRIPGNLADAPTTCGQAGCHAGILTRVERSIMTTMAGVIEVNRSVLGEPAAPPGQPPHAAHLGHGVADSHLRELCVGCHLGQAKSEAGPITESSQGGGCLACHLVYDEPARANHAARTAAAAAAPAIADKGPAAAATATPAAPSTAPPATTPGSASGRAAPAGPRLASGPAPGPPKTRPFAHPGLTLNPDNGHCFACHSRSGRVALSYEGWHELRGAPSRPDARLRQLADGRTLEFVAPDVHHERGLECIDCHTAREVMGSGAVVARKSDQQRITCTDCHAARLASVALAEADPESHMLLALRGWALAPGERLGAARQGDVLVNVTVDALGRGTLRRKRDGAVHPLKPPAAACQAGPGHARLACTSCHSAWAPRCTTCHTAFDPADEGFDHAAQQWVPGTWNESAGPFEATLPTLGVRGDHGAPGGTRELVDTVVPGMIMAFDRNRSPGGRPDIVFRRLYAHSFAHTIRREARSCASCHADPLALGYGKGRLAFDRAARRWTFRASEPPSPHDGLPADAWTGFGQTRSGMVSTRVDVRPFSAAEQQSILRVGACLGCHDGATQVMRDAVVDFEAVLARRSRHCVVPASR